MKVAYVTAGAAGMFCGSCMRDNTLVRTLRRAGHDVALVPTFTPIRTDEEDVSADHVFLGGINLYLDQRSSGWRRLPAAARKWLDRPALLRTVARRALGTRRSDDAELAISLLRGEHGNQRREIEEMVRWLARDLQPDLVHLSNLLIAGFVPVLRRHLDVPVLVTLQGDDLFLDDLPAAERARVVEQLRRVAKTIDGFVVMSDYYRDHMAALLDVPPERFHHVRLGLAEPESFAPPDPRDGPDTPVPPRPPTIGYLARLCPEKGFDLLVDAFLELRAMPQTSNVRLRVGGWLGARDRAFFDAQVAKIGAANAIDAFDHVPLPDREAKIRFLHGLDVFSVPTRYREPKGLFALEALAAGVPVVLPRHGSLPELVATTGGARLVPPGDAGALTTALHDLLRDPQERRRLGAEGRRGVNAEQNAAAAAEDTLAVWMQLLEET